MKTFTLEQIRNYILKFDPMWDFDFILSEDAIIRANPDMLIEEDEEVNRNWNEMNRMLNEDGKRNYYTEEEIDKLEMSTRSFTIQNETPDFGPVDEF